MKVVISGYGRMGHMIEAVLIRRGIEVAGASEDIVNFDDAIAAESVCIDFTTPDAFRANYKAIARKFKAVVIGTTGWNDIKDEVLGYFAECGTPVVYSSNYSIGVNVLFAAVQRASELLKGHGYEPHVHEVHHIHKLDSPSGTAKSLAALVAEGLGVAPEISAERIGEVPGIHTVEFSGNCDKLSFTHEAYSREGFAEGAVAAALLTEGLQGAAEFKDLLFR
ncbi:MAG: 4-hydroxy-tetrahydrodipicolinate reductase [Bacteroidales bacterium]|nr:4-hydroxy-tetrahydrodipicolinate reductase [Candidatus Cryptobacteroides caccocaballi]